MTNKARFALFMLVYGAERITRTRHSIERYYWAVQPGYRQVCLPDRQWSWRCSRALLAAVGHWSLSRPGFYVQSFITVFAVLLHLA